MDAMDGVRKRLRTIQIRNDAWSATNLKGWARFKFLVVKITRPFWQRIKAIRQIVELTSKYGRAVRRKSNVGIAQQVWQQYQGAIEHGMPPHKYYHYSIHSDFERIGQYIPKMTWGLLLQDLLAVQGAEERKILDDKRLSDQHFQEHELATIPILAEFDNGEVKWRNRTGSSVLPVHDLFSKPAGANQGRGAHRWKTCSNERYLAEDGSVVTPAELIGRLKRQSVRKVILLQPRVLNHARLRLLSGDTLVSLRIITMRRPREEATYLMGSISLPVGDVTGSNTQFGSLRAPVAEATGRLGAAYDQTNISRVTEPITDHPITGKRIQGFELPLWKETVDLAIRAHETLPDIALIGWDIAVTPDGPVIIEGNSNPGADMLQVSHKMPLGATDFPALYLANLRDVLSGEKRAVIES
jgi:hypothetical protein